MLLEPLHLLKKADAELNITQGVLEGVVGEELGVLPGMDSVFTLLALERLVGFLGNLGRRNLRKDKYDIIIYDGINTEETLRMIGVTSRARLGNCLFFSFSHLVIFMQSHDSTQIVLEISAQHG